MLVPHFESWAVFDKMQDLFEGFDLTLEAREEIPINTIRLKTIIDEDEYTKYIKETFDLSLSSASVVDIPYNFNIDEIKDWNIGVICGSSGSGKSTILRHICGGDIKQAHFDNSKSVISNFTRMNAEDASKLLSSIGLASVPTWLRPYNCLSNGEKYRAELAKIISESEEEIIFVDEYTSVVDRNVAMSMSNALQKYIRKTNKKIVVATCHYDIFEWLRPDWIYDLNKGGVLEECEYLRQRPKIEIQAFRTTTDTWEMFKKHHYMTSDLHSASMCFVFCWDEKPVGFYSILPLPSGNFNNGWREHRLVVLPDYQGCGIGSGISNLMGGILKADNKTLFAKTVNPALGEYRENSSKWKATSHNRKGMTESEASRMTGGLQRVSYCHRYCGEPIYGYEELLMPIGEIRKQKEMKGQLTLF